MVVTSKRPLSWLELYCIQVLQLQYIRAQYPTGLKSLPHKSCCQGNICFRLGPQGDLVPHLNYQILHLNKSDCCARSNLPNTTMCYQTSDRPRLRVFCPFWCGWIWTQKMWRRRDKRLLFLRKLFCAHISLLRHTVHSGIFGTALPQGNFVPSNTIPNDLLHSSTIWSLAEIEHDDLCLLSWAFDRQ